MKRMIADCTAFSISLLVYFFQIDLPWSIIPVAALGILRIRWQIFGCYFAAVLYFASGCIDNYFDIPMTIISILCVILVILSFFNNLAFPLFNLPLPSGQYKIGTRISSWYDKERDRRLSIQLWYPSEQTTTNQFDPLPFWWPNSTKIGSELCRLFGMPFFLLFHLDHCKSNSYLELPVIHQSLPIIIFSHGFYGFKGDRSYFSEQFASNGYIVLGIDHPGDCAVCIFPDGHSIPFSAHLKPNDDEWMVRNAGLSDRIKDIDFVIDRLKLIKQGKEIFDSIEQILKDCMDFDQLGCFGHSYGSATIVKYLREGRNVKYVKSAVGLDPWVFPLEDDVDNNGVSKPLLFLSSDEWEAGNKYKERRKNIIKNSTKGSVSFIIKHTNHHNFDDMPFIVHPFIARKLGFIGKISTALCFTITSEFSISFFDTFVRGIKSSKQFPTLDVIYEESRSDLDNK